MKNEFRLHVAEPTIAHAVAEAAKFTAWLVASYSKDEAAARAEYHASRAEYYLRALEESEQQ